MTQERPSLLSRIKTMLRYWLASAAMRYCGPELIYWIDPNRWEEFMDTDAEDLPYGYTEVTIDMGSFTMSLGLGDILS